MYNISNTIRKLMIDKNMTVTPLADKIGVAQQALSRKINNPNEDYKFSYLQNLAVALGCKLQINIIDSESNEILYTLEDKEVL